MLEQIEHLVKVLQEDGKDGIKKKEYCIQLIEKGLKYLFFYSYDGLRFLPQDQEYMLRLFVNMIFTDENARIIKKILYYEKNMQHFFIFAEEKRMEMEKIYGKYFHTQSYRIKKNLYNPILNMYWDSQKEIWISKKEDGTVCFTAFMPVDN